MNHNSSLRDLIAQVRQNADTKLTDEQLQVLVGGLVDGQSQAESFVILNQAFGQPPPSADIQITHKGNHDAISTFIQEKLLGNSAKNAMEGLTLLEALFHINGALASSIFTQEGFVDDVMDALDLYGVDLSVTRAGAALFSQSCQSKPARELVSSKALAWLRSVVKKRDSDDLFRTSAATTLIKLSKTAEAQSPQGENDLVLLLREVLVNGSEHSQAAALEGLAYSSGNPSVKELLSLDEDVFKSMASIVEHWREDMSSQHQVSTALYSVAVIIANLVSFQPRLSEQEAQVQKLRNLAAKGKESSLTEAEKLDDDEHVTQRVRRVAKMGALSLLSKLVKLSNSMVVLETVGQAYLNIVEVKDLRGQALQTGASKSLMKIISTAGSEDKTTQSPNFSAVQALAKLCITSSPQQVFGPDESLVKDAVRPLVSMLLHPSANSLQRFEAMMALTNLASVGGTVSKTMTSVSGLLDKLDFLLLDDNNLIRRASIELLCNLVGSSEDAYNRYGGSAVASSNALQSKIHVLVALSDVEDIPTRSAASAVLAIITSSRGPCLAIHALQVSKGKVIPIILGLIDVKQNMDDSEGSPAPLVMAHGLFLRGITCLHNVLENQADTSAKRLLASEAVNGGLKQMLAHAIQIFEGDANGIREPVVSILKQIQGLGL